MTSRESRFEGEEIVGFIRTRVGPPYESYGNYGQIMGRRADHIYELSAPTPRATR